MSTWNFMFGWPLVLCPLEMQRVPFKEFTDTDVGSVFLVDNYWLVSGIWHFKQSKDKSTRLLHSSKNLSELLCS